MHSEERNYIETKECRKERKMEGILFKVQNNVSSGKITSLSVLRSEKVMGFLKVHER